MTIEEVLESIKPRKKVELEYSGKRQKLFISGEARKVLNTCRDIHIEWRQAYTYCSGKKKTLVIAGNL